MSILIKGATMPRLCRECACVQPSFSGTGHFCGADNYARDVILNGVPPIWCPLVEIPPHGRLIDGDALKRLIGSYNPIKYTYEYGDVITVADIDTAPIIIEAEEGEGE